MNTLKELETLKAELIARGNPKYVIKHLERIMSHLEPVTPNFDIPYLEETINDLNKLAIRDQVLFGDNQ